MLQNLQQSTEKISYSMPATPTQISAQSQQDFMEQLKQQKERLLREAEERRKVEDKLDRESGRRSHQGSIKSSVSPSISISELKDERAATQQSAVHVYSAGYPSFRPNNQLRADLSFEEDTTSAVSQTSSTSGIQSFSRYPHKFTDRQSINSHKATGMTKEMENHQKLPYQITEVFDHFGAGSVLLLILQA